MARSGEVTATASTAVLFPGGTADSGTWTAGPVGQQLALALTAGGIAVLQQATCTFSFAGKVGTSPVTGVSTVALAARPTALQVGGASLLLDGDRINDAFGNALAADVAPDSKLSSA